MFPFLGTVQVECGAQAVMSVSAGRAKEFTVTVEQDQPAKLMDLTRLGIFPFIRYDKPVVCDDAAHTIAAEFVVTGVTGGKDQRPGDRGVKFKGGRTSCTGV